MKVLLLSTLFVMLLQSSNIVTGSELSSEAEGVLVDAIVTDNGDLVVVTIDNFNRQLYFRFTIFFANPVGKPSDSIMTDLLPDNLPPDKVVTRIHNNTLHIIAGWYVTTFPNGQTIHYKWVLPTTSLLFLPIVLK